MANISEKIALTWIIQDFSFPYNSQFVRIMRPGLDKC